MHRRSYFSGSGFLSFEFLSATIIFLSDVGLMVRNVFYSNAATHRIMTPKSLIIAVSLTLGYIFSVGTWWRVCDLYRKLSEVIPHTRDETGYSFEIGLRVTAFLAVLGTTFVLLAVFGLLLLGTGRVP